ncbi:hypothetical protein BJY04DRAFT_16799 [Aspergillus karnatakaensis]|uniref:uncharacterized protein n=1 Tax=Aspergillus karnatakaensis TaxID=1810916 RepID=UPI003CCDF670
MAENQYVFSLQARPYPCGVQGVPGKVHWSRHTGVELNRLIGDPAMAVTTDIHPESKLPNLVPFLPVMLLCYPPAAESNPTIAYLDWKNVQRTQRPSCRTPFDSLTAASDALNKATSQHGLGWGYFGTSLPLLAIQREDHFSIQWSGRESVN